MYDRCVNQDSGFHAALRYKVSEAGHQFESVFDQNQTFATIPSAPSG
jgi:hypothetical protein